MAKQPAIPRPEAIWPLVPTAEIGQQLGVSRATLKRWRQTGAIVQNVHWQFAPGTKARILWNRDLMRSWVACGGDKNQLTHQRAIESYSKSLPCTAA
jgi:hypothetical protein